MNSGNRALVIVPCGKAKIWDKIPSLGAVLVRDAYVGGPFLANRANAERFGAAWVILSAKHGFLSPDDLLPGPYEVTFSRKATNPVSTDTLTLQVAELEPGRLSVVVALEGIHYRTAVESAFAATDSRIVAPIAGLPLDLSLRAIKRAIASGESGWIEKPLKAVG